MISFSCCTWPIIEAGVTSGISWVLCVATVATSQGGDGRSPLYFPRTLSGSGPSPPQLLGTQTPAVSRHCTCTWHEDPPGGGLAPDTWHEDPPGGGLAPGLHLGGGQPRHGGHGVQHTQPRYGGGGINNSRILEFVLVLLF